MCSCEQKKEITDVKVIRYSYSNGQILFPDYAHDDTLIVVDAQYLNLAFDVLKPATDGEISNVLHLGCANYVDYQKHPEDFINIKIGETDSFMDI
jgi:hypothetical protein